MMKNNKQSTARVQEIKDESWGLWITLPHRQLTAYLLRYLGTLAEFPLHRKAKQDCGKPST